MQHEILRKNGGTQGLNLEPFKLQNEIHLADGQDPSR